MKNNQLKAGAMLSLLTFGAANVLGLLYTPYMLRMMGQEEYGLYSLVASVVSYLTMLDFGFGNAIVRYTNLYNASGRYDELPCLYGLFTRLYVDRYSCVVSRSHVIPEHRESFWKDDDDRRTF